jgi:hypothetical protein
MVGGYGPLAEIVFSRCHPGLPHRAQLLEAEDSILFPSLVHVDEDFQLGKLAPDFLQHFDVPLVADERFGRGKIKDVVYLGLFEILIDWNTDKAGACRCQVTDRPFRAIITHDRNFALDRSQAERRQAGSDLFDGKPKIAISDWNPAPALLVLKSGFVGEFLGALDEHVTHIGDGNRVVVRIFSFHRSSLNVGRRARVRMGTSSVCIELKAARAGQGLYNGQTLPCFRDIQPVKLGDLALSCGWRPPA